MALDYGINDVLNPFLPSIAFHIEPIHLIYIINQMTGFFMKRNTGLKCVKRVAKYIIFSCKTNAVSVDRMSCWCSASPCNIYNHSPRHRLYIYNNSCLSRNLERPRDYMVM